VPAHGCLPGIEAFTMAMLPEGSSRMGSRGLLSRRQLCAGCGALVAGALLAGCGDKGSGRPTIQGAEPDAREDHTNRELQKLLDRRAAAVTSGDEAAFLADIDPNNAELLQHERMVFANLRELGFTDFRFIAERAEPRPGTSGDGSTLYSPVIEVAQLKVDSGPGGVAPAESFRYETVTRDDRLVITNIVPITRANAKEETMDPGVYANAPWNSTSLKVINVGNVWLAGDRSVPDLDRYASAAQRQVGKVEALWGSRNRFPGYIFFFSRDEAELSNWYETRAASNKYEGVQVPLQGVRKDGDVYSGQYAGSRIIVNLASTELHDDDPELVMRHELAHAVTSQATSVNLGMWLLGAPRWAIEGFARWVENWEHPNRRDGQRALVADGVRSGKFTGKPPETENFYGADISFNYALGASVFDHIERTKGRDAAIEFYAQVIQYQDMENTPIVDLPAFDGVCKRVTGLDGDAFLARWAAAVRGGGA
jgi:hypothetical protein